MNKYEYLESEMNKLVGILYNMYSIVKEILENTIRLFIEEDQDKRRLIRENIEKQVNTVDVLRQDSFKNALLFIARFQPLGRELRFIEAYINVCYDIYRISRYCREISRIDDIIDNLYVEEFRDLREGLKWAKEMVELAFRGFIENRLDYAKRVLDMDSKLDNMYVGYLKKLTTMETVSRYYAAKIVIARHVERIGDHATYIANHTLSLEQGSS